MTPDEYANRRVAELIAECIHNARDREMLYANLVDGVSYGELADQYHLTYDGVKKIMRKGKKEVFRHY